MTRCSPQQWLNSRCALLSGPGPGPIPDPPARSHSCVHHSMHPTAPTTVLHHDVCSWPRPLQHAVPWHLSYELVRCRPATGFTVSLAVRSCSRAMRLQINTDELPLGQLSQDQVKKGLDILEVLRSIEHGACCCSACMRRPELLLCDPPDDAAPACTCSSYTGGRCARCSCCPTR